MSILQTPWPAFFVKAGIFESVDNIVSTTTRRDTKKPMARFVNEYLIQGVGVDCTSAGCRSGSGISGRRLEVELLAREDHRARMDKRIGAKDLGAAILDQETGPDGSRDQYMDFARAVATLRCQCCYRLPP